MVDLEEWIWDCYPIQIRHGGLKPTIRMMYTDVYRGSITNNTKGLVEHGCTSSRGMGGTHFHTQLEAVKTFELCRHRSAQHQLGLLKMRCPNYLQAMDMETIWNHVLFIPNRAQHINPQCCLPAISQSPGWQRWGSCCCGLFGFLWHGRWSEIGRFCEMSSARDGRWGSDQQHFMQMDWGCHGVFCVLGDGHN